MMPISLSTEEMKNIFTGHKELTYMSIFGKYLTESCNQLHI